MEGKENVNHIQKLKTANENDLKFDIVSCDIKNKIRTNFADIDKRKLIRNLIHNFTIYLNTLNITINDIDFIKYELNKNIKVICIVDMSQNQFRKNIF